MCHANSSFLNRNFTVRSHTGVLLSLWWVLGLTPHSHPVLPGQSPFPASRHVAQAHSNVPPRTHPQVNGVSLAKDMLSLGTACPHCLAHLQMEAPPPLAQRGAILKDHSSPLPGSPAALLSSRECCQEHAPVYFLQTNLCFLFPEKHFPGRKTTSQ